MALPITILKNVLDFNLMHIEKVEMDTVKIHAYGEVHDQERILVHARPFKRIQCKCPISAINVLKTATSRRRKAPGELLTLTGFLFISCTSLSVSSARSMGHSMNLSPGRMEPADLQQPSTMRLHGSYVR